MLLKIGEKYVNTDLILRWEPYPEAVYGYNYSDELVVAVNETDEAIALLRWLDAQAVDVMAEAAPAPVETGCFKVGDDVLHLEYGTGKVNRVDGERVELAFDMGEGVQSMRWITDLSEILVPPQPRDDTIPF